MKHRPGRRRKCSYNSSTFKRSRREKGNCGKKNSKDKDRRLKGSTVSVSAWRNKRKNDKYGVSKNERRGRTEGNERTVIRKKGKRRKDVVVKTSGTRLTLRFKLNYSSL